MTTSLDNVNQSAGVPADDLLELVHEVMHLLRGRQYRTADGRAPELTHMDGKVLAFFARRPGATQADLSAASGRDKGQLARLIGGLKMRGLVEAQIDDADRRNQRLTLTPEGRSTHQSLLRRRRKLAEDALAGLDEADRQRLRELLSRVRTNLAQAD